MGSLFILRRLVWLVLLGCTYILFTFAHASSHHDWLLSQQVDDGSIVSASPLSMPVQGTHETLAAISLDKISAHDTISLAQQYLASVDTADTEALARVISAKSLAGVTDQSLIIELASRQNSDGGFGFYNSYESDPLNTAYALNALATVNTTSSQVAKAVGYLLLKRQQDGSWKLNSTSSVALTSEVVLALASQTRYQGVSAAIASARAYLLNQKKSDHVWGQTFESALALSALTTGANNSSELSASVQAILSRGSNNNWHDDVYTTALVLQAFKRVNSIGSTTSGKGLVKGQVLIVGSTQPVVGASVAVTNTNLQVVTDAQGFFNLANVPEGNQTLVISKAGFSSVSAVAIVENAMLTDVGQLVLGQATSGGIVAGKIFASGSLTEISGASIMLRGPGQVAASSNSAGQFELTNLPNGNYSFTITAAGYHQVSGSFSLVSGQNIQINQGLVSLDSPLVSGPASLSGKVIDGTTASPVANAQVLIAGISVTTNHAGKFITQPLNRGSHTIQIQAPNYINTSYSINFLAGATGGPGSLAIYKIAETELPTTVDLLATTIDDVSSAPIAGAVVKLLDPQATAITDTSGNANLSGIEHGSN